jgi:ribosomal protein S25
MRRAQILERVYKEIERVGCVTSSAVAERLWITHNELFYVLRRLRQEGRVEAASLDRVALW